MNIDECFLLGYVIKKHGLKGEVNIHFDVDDPLEYSELESVFIEFDQKLVPFFIDHVSIKGDRAVVRFEGVDDIDRAEELKGKQLYLPLAVLPKLEGKAFYYHEVMGFRVRDAKLGEIGLIKDIYTSGRQDLLAVEFNDREILIPVSDDILVGLDREARVMEVALPDGLLDIYME